MIVKYTKLDDNNSSLTLGKNYIVISISIRPDEKQPLITIRRNDDGTPCVFSLALFDVIDSQIPQNWEGYELNSGFKGYYRLQPIKFHGNFWHDYHDGHEKADELFEKVYSLLNDRAIINGYQV